MDFKKFLIFLVLTTLMVLLHWCFLPMDLHKLALVIPNSQDQLDRLQQEASCSGKPLLPPFVDFEQLYAISPYHSLSICKIRKSMSTLMSGIACVLYDTELFMRNNRSILEMWEGRFCEERNEYDSLEQVEKHFDKKNYTKLVVIRNPIERFVSFFADKCVIEVRKFPEQTLCYNCQGNMTCFLEIQYNRFLDHAKPNSTLWKTYEDYHAAPLSWNCDFKHQLSDYKVIRMGAANPTDRRAGIQEILSVLREHHVANETIDFIEKSAISGSTEHATYQSEAHKMVWEQIRSDKVIRSWLRRIYYLDFLIFGFDTDIID